MITLKPLHSIVLCAALLLACNKENAPDCIKQSGENAIAVRTLDPFQRIEISDYIFITLVQSDTHKVEINAPINLIPKIKTNIDQGILTIENTNTCNFVRSFKKKISIKIFAPHFYNIQNRGTGNIATQGTIRDNYFKIENHHASGDIDLSFEGDSISALIQTGVSNISIQGQAFKAELFNQGLGFIDAKNLFAEQAYINNSSINDIYARSSSYVFGKIVYSGNIYLIGQPSLVDTDITGNGQIIVTP